MNEIIELLGKVSVEICNEGNEKVMQELAKKIETMHKDQIIAAYNRGRASTMGMFMMDAETYYTKNYATD